MSRLLSGLLLLLLWQSCHSELPEPPPPAFDSPWRDRLAAVGEAYAELRLDTALAEARGLRWAVAHSPTPPDPGLRAEVYQYLALLHYDHSLHPDSIHYYTDAAAELIGDAAPPELLARQMLCHASSSWFHFAYLEMDMAAELGKQLLEQADRRSASGTYAQLLIAQGVARKKLSDPLEDAAARHRGLGAAEARFRRAADLLRHAGSPRYRQALDELAILYQRFPGGAQRAEEIMAQLHYDPATPRPFFGLPNRIRGYFHGHSDTAATYYRQLLAEPGPRNFKYRTEAGFRLTGAAQLAGDHQTALYELWREMEDAGCCPPGYQLPEGEEPRDCTVRAGCNYYLAARADIYLQRYLSLGRTADLVTANELCQLSLDYYERSFQTATEESVLNKIDEIGHRLLDVALAAAATRMQLAPTQANADALLRAMEMGKTFLLTRDILEADVPAAATAGQSSQALRVATNLLKDRYARHYSLSEQDLRRFFQLTQASRKLEEGARASFNAELGGFDRGVGFPDVHDIRSGLGPGQVFLEYAEADTTLFGLLVSCDTFRVFRVDTAVRHLAVRLTAQLSDAGNVSATDYAGTAGALYERLLGPVAGDLRPGDELLVVASHSLNTVPFSALTPTAGATAYAELEYVLDRHAVQYLPSWRVHRQLEPHRLATLPDRPTTGAWTHPELQHYLGAIGDRLTAAGGTGSRHYRGGPDAREGFLRESGQYDLLHLSVHARGNPQRLYDNYLYLTPQDSLNGLHIGPRDLNARLVVLAACSTARGHANRGEGTFSLTRSFHLAGVPDVVCSLYDVPALATGRVLEQFYTYLYAGYSPAASLTLAQRRCRSGALGDRMARPQNWGGMILG